MDPTERPPATAPAPPDRQSTQGDAYPAGADVSSAGLERRGLPERIAYLQGLAAGLGTDEEGPRTQLLRGTLDALEDLAHAAERLDDGLDTLAEHFDDLGRRLRRLETVLDDEGAVWEVPCPACMEIFAVSDDDLFGTGVAVRCPNCQTVVRWGRDAAGAEGGEREKREKRDGEPHEEDLNPEPPEHLEGSAVPHPLEGDHQPSPRPRPQSRIGHPPCP